VRNLNILPRKESERTGILHILRIIEEGKKYEHIYGTKKGVRKDGNITHIEDN